MLKLLNLYFTNYKKKIYILLKTKNSLEQKKKLSFIKNFFKSNCVFKKSSEWKHSYNTLDSFENIISMCSTLGYEAIVRKKKLQYFHLIKFKDLNIILDGLFIIKLNVIFFQQTI